MNIIPFNFDSQALRTVMHEGEPWFHAADVCNAIGHSNPSRAVASAVDPEDQAYLKLGLAGSTPIFVNEIGLYALVLGSQLPAAKRFKRWVLGDVLPTIRKTGAFGVAAPNDAALATLRRIHAEADREVERRTQNDFHRPGSARAEEHVKAVIADVAARRGLDVDTVTLGFRTTVNDVMATAYGDTVALARIERKRLALPAPKRRPRVATRRRTA